MDSVAGENSDVYLSGVKIHIQTEDWGLQAQVIMCRLFKNGSVLQSYQLPYHKIPNFSDPKMRRKAVSQLHQYAIEQLNQTA